jgi:N-acetylglucosamine-6-sulfatase
MNCGGVLSIEGIAGDDGQKLTFFASNHCDDSPKYAKTVANLKQRLASLRKCIGDDGRDFPGTEKVVQEFWNYDAADREKARKISGEFLQQRLQALKASPKRKKK